MRDILIWQYEVIFNISKDTRGLNEECLNHYEIGLDEENGITFIVMPMFRMLSESETNKIKKENE